MMASTIPCKADTGFLRVVHLRCKTNGFTLIDVLIVVLLLGIVGMVAIPQFHSVIFEAKLNEATGELVAGLEYARNLAVSYQRPFGLKADTGLNTFAVLDARYESDPLPHHADDPPVDSQGVVLNPLEKTWYEKDFNTMTEYTGVAITAAPVGGVIYFYPDGHSDSSDNTFTLTLEGEQRTVTVNGTTGCISVN